MTTNIVYAVEVSNISSAYFYFHWYLKKDITHVKFSNNTQTTIY